ncbi:hybrid sensor histidine kinase/response regulator [Labilibacter marinus]|uniref:hybrid sensor histidine kinase/response regulator n=1 Tax=Labilibacter marinus TaxID=1477105 RepID=UPI00130138FF|nr:two-component regulator propeller domain-containing protein [Labilibacter marinus]
MTKNISLLIIAFFLLKSFGLGAQNKQFFDYNEGLSNSLINDVYQDHLGFIWVATEDGLNRFDGIQFTTFTEEKHQLKANYVTTLTQDRENNIWIGYVNGVQVYNHQQETFSEIEIYIEDQQINPFVTAIIESQNGDIWIATSGYGLVQIPKETGRPKYSTRLNNKFSSLHIRALFEDKDGLLWIGSDNDGMNTYNPTTGEIKNYSSSIDNALHIPGNDISSITGDLNGHIYIGSLKEGLCKLNKETGEVTRIHVPRYNKFQIPVKKLMIDSEQQLWVGSDGLGLYLYDEKSESLKEHAPSNSTFDFSKSKVHCLMDDNDGNLWTGIFQKGLFLFSRSKQIFNHYGYRAFGDNSIGSSCVTALDGNNETLWIGTDGDGVYKLNKSTQAVEHIQLKSKPNEHVSNNVFSLNSSDDNTLWVGTYSNGLIKYNKQTGDVRTFKNEKDNINSIAGDRIGCIIKENEEKLWIGTLGNGITQLNTKTNLFTPGLNMNDSLNSLIPLWVNDIFIDENRNFWIATYDGIVLANPQQQRVSVFNAYQNYLPSNVVYCIKQDALGNIWLGTYKGLVKVSTLDMTFKTFTSEDGMSGNVVCAIEEDEHNQLWISTHTGLSRLNPINNTFVNYYASDGLQANEFYRNSVFKSNNKSIYFGGINGITEVRKDYNNYKASKPKVMLTGFERLNQAVKIGDKSGKYTILNKSITVADSIHLSEKDNVFSISFTSAELAKQSSISYEYMMEGFDLTWVKSNSLSRMATYTNLPFGSYNFLVRSVDKKLYSEPRKLTITIHPPWYKTNAAKMLWVSLLGILTFAIFQLYKQTFKRIEVEKLNEKKMQFFINISHEIRTPLSLIIDPLEKLLELGPDKETKRLYAIMQQNANRIFRLINQLMDVRKIEKGRMLVKYQETNLIAFVEEICESYKYMASSKNIQFNINAAETDINIWMDPLNFEKVIINLLSNAFKFTPNNGDITVDIALIQNNETSHAYAQITVSDSGMGIKKQDLEKVFNRFYQVNTPETRHITGTGIGLHLSRSLVELHKGQLFAENGDNGIGTKFYIQIPLGKDHLPEEDLIVDKNLLPAPSNSFRKNTQPETDFEESTKPKTAYKIMVVEDEIDIRNYLSAELSKRYKVVSCENGKEAHAIVLSEQPDLIISDIMMPEMDGITFCKKIKSNVETNHIPVILLTALSKEEDKAEGIETGADMYLVKPFNTNFLQKSIANLIENRKKIFAKSENKSEKYQVEPIEIQSHDEILMQKVMTIIRDNISNNDLNVEMLADGIGISRVHMHRKLKEITNQSARDLIKNVRMKQAAYILVNKKLNISDVAYSLGYSSLSHFSTTFKSYYGVSPKEYAEQQQNNPDL